MSLLVAFVSNVLQLLVLMLVVSFVFGFALASVIFAGDRHAGSTC